jgi:hypothetical protein
MVHVMGIWRAIRLDVGASRMATKCHDTRLYLSAAARRIDDPGNSQADQHKYEEFAGV